MIRRSADYFNCRVCNIYSPSNHCWHIEFDTSIFLLPYVFSFDSIKYKQSRHQQDSCCSFINLNLIWAFIWKVWKLEYFFHGYFLRILRCQRNIRNLFKVFWSNQTGNSFFFMFEYMLMSIMVQSTFKICFTYCYHMLWFFIHCGTQRIEVTVFFFLLFALNWAKNRT